MEKLFKWVQEMYPDKTDEERLQQIEKLVKQDIFKVSFERTSKEFTIDGFVHEDTEYLPTCQQPKFKVGDTVRVTEKLKEYVHKNSWSITMSCYIGREFELDLFLPSCNGWVISDAGPFSFPEDCLELVKDKG